MVFSASLIGSGFPVAESCLVDGFAFLPSDRDERNEIVGATRGIFLVAKSPNTPTRKAKPDVELGDKLADVIPRERRMLFAVWISK